MTRQTEETKETNKVWKTANFAAPFREAFDLRIYLFEMIYFDGWYYGLVLRIVRWSFRQEMSVVKCQLHLPPTHKSSPFTNIKARKSSLAILQNIFRTKKEKGKATGHSF